MSENQTQNSQPNQSAVVAFDAKVSQAIVAKDLSSGAQSFRFMQRKAFALTKHALDENGNPLKGNALKRAHYAYLDKCASESGGEVVKQISTGQLRVTGWNVNANGNAGSIRVETAQHFARHQVKATEPKAPKLTEDKVLEFIAKSKGVSVEDIRAALTLALTK